MLSLGIGTALATLAICLVMLGLAQINPRKNEPMTTYITNRAESLEEEARDAQTFADTLWTRVDNYKQSLDNVRINTGMLEALAQMRRDARKAQADADDLARRAAAARRMHPNVTTWSL